MEKYYIYCNKNQAYHALLNNAILSNTLTKETFRADSLSFLSKYFIFITKEIVSSEMMKEGCTEIYHPVVFEIEYNKEKENIPAYLIYKNENTTISVSLTLSSLNNYTDGCIGAFIFGEIPISMLSGILFTSESDLRGFSQPAPDLWDPKQLYNLLPTTQSRAIVLDDVKTAAKQLDDAEITNASDLNKFISMRLKQKAEAYYLIEGTNDWKKGNVRGNVDGHLQRYLNNKILTDEIGKLLVTFKNEGQQLLEPDALLTPLLENKDGNIFGKITACIETDNQPEIDFNSLKSKVLSEFADCNDDLEIIENFVYKRTINDSKVVFAKIKHPGFKALAVFLDNQNDGRLLRNACRKLTQEERRYAYILFAAHQGMKSVSGDKKENRELERHIEETIYIKNDALPELISLQPNSSINCGFKPEIKRWFNDEEAYTLIKEKATDIQIEKICQYTWNSCTEIKKCFEFEEKETIQIKAIAQKVCLTEEDALQLKSLAQKLCNAAKSHKGMVPNCIKARDVLSNSKVFAKVNKLAPEQVQSICNDIMSLQCDGTSA